jgi:5-formyltetrahydrofolate cyclo-ligase
MPKTLMRHEMLIRRLAMPEGERLASATDLMQKALATLQKKSVHSVAGYYPIKGELDTFPLLEVLHDKGTICALPIIEKDTHLLKFRKWHPDMRLTLDKFGIGEPPSSSPEIFPDVLLVPLLAFDSEKHRLGYGGGYYDATIAHLRAVNPRFQAFGCAYRWQKVSKLPRIPSDVALDKIFTV